MNSKILLLSIAVISVGLFAMPSTLSLFAGQHSFDKAGNTTICAKCHSDVLSEINSGGYHKSLIGATDNACKGCHTADRIKSSLIYGGNRSADGTKYNYSSTTNYAGLNLSSGTFVYANSTDNETGYDFGGGVHAAVTVECVWCHGEVNLTNDAHTVYASYANGNVTQLRGSNAACIGCHTKALVNMTWVRKAGYNTTYYFDNGSLQFDTTTQTTNTTYTENQ